MRGSPIVESEEALMALKPDMAAISAMGPDTLIVTGPSSTSDFVVRVFAPRVGLPEDPVCGTAHRAIAPYWAARLGRKSLVARQGSRRGGEIICDLTEDLIAISGRATLFLEGRIECHG